jgi:hypothetical protein
MRFQGSIKLLLILLFFLSTSFGLGFKSSLTAQEQSSEQTDRISLSPSLARVSPGENYELTLSNETSESISVNLVPRLFEFSESGQIVPLTESEEPESLNFDQYIEIAESDISIEANGDKSVLVSYFSKPDSYGVGVIAQISSTTEEGNVDISKNLASVITDIQLTEAEASSIQRQVEISPVFGAGNINLVNNSLVNVEITNTTGKFVELGGETIVYSGEKRIGSILLTNDLDRRLLPGESTSATFEFVDQRNSLDRIDRLRFETNLTINSQEIKVVNEMNSFPLELAFASTLILLFGGIAIYFLVRRFGLNRQS